MENTHTVLVVILLIILCCLSNCDQCYTYWFSIVYVSREERKTHIFDTRFYMNLLLLPRCLRFPFFQILCHDWIVLLAPCCCYILVPDAFFFHRPHNLNTRLIRSVDGAEAGAPVRDLYEEFLFSELPFQCALAPRLAPRYVMFFSSWLP